MTTAKISTTQSEDKRQALFASLQTGVQTLLGELRQGKSERLVALLQFSSQFHRYSPRNQWLIELECCRRGIAPNYAAGFITWNKLGYRVKKGEKGLPILQPKPVVLRDEETGVEKSHLFFKKAYVFADCQVEPMQEGMQLPTFFTPLQGDCDVLYDRLLRVIRADGISVSEVTDTAGAQGYSAKGRIGLKPRLDSTSRFLTLLHEYAHELMHPEEVRKSMTKQVKECQAEATAYIVAQHFGVHNPFSSDYLLQWGNDEKTLMAEIEAVQRAASLIIAKMSPQEQDDIAA